MGELAKRGRGQPKKRPTFTKSFRVEQDVKDFLDSLKAMNEFLVLQIKKTSEFQEFLLKQEEELNKKTRSLFDGLDDELSS